MATISAVISAYNEEEKIAACLESVSWTDEIILVDSSSTDNTSKIAKKYGVKLYKRQNNPMLNINKNYGIEKATSDWVLCLDADERVTPQLAKEIEQMVEVNEKTDINGFWIARKNIILGKWMEHTGWYPDYQMRLIRKDEGKFPANHVHEMIEVTGQTAYLTEPMIHYNFDTVSQFLHKHIELYAPNEAAQILKKGYTFSYLDAISMPMGEFLSRFFAREGYKDGLHGLVLSMLMAFYHLIIFTKIWEYEKFKEYNNSKFFDNVSSELKKSFNETTYWIANEKLKRSKNLIEQTVLRVQRKIRS